MILLGSSQSINTLKRRLCMIIGVESLNGMFEQDDNTNLCTYGGKCHNCGSDVEVVITRTAGGYGLHRGVLYEPNPENFVVLCSDCYEKSGKPICVDLRSSSLSS
jgi:hypothetical protein